MKNNSENKHTEGEWIAGIYLDEASIYCGSKKRGIAKFRFNEFDYPNEEIIANAEHICKCVNAHDELVAALKMFVSDFEKTCPTLAASGLEIKYNLAKSALQKAGIESLQKSSS